MLHKIAFFKWKAKVVKNAGAQFSGFPQSQLKVETGDSESFMVWSRVSTKYIENIATFMLNRLG